MSVQFGRWNLDGRPVDPAYLWKVRGMLAPYGPDGEGTYIEDSVAILYRPFHTTKESRRETQPVLLPSGEVLTWDGRLDNREDLISSLRDRLSIDSTDAAIVAAAYGRWGTDCFARLIGDWALAIWNPRERSLILAKDFIGTRHLYYAADEGMISWSTILDPLVLLAGRTFTLEEEYIAGWLGQFPATHLTPYVGISSVPPSCFVCLKPARKVVTKYWDFDPGKKVRYENDAEYEEHFRIAFRESVRRRLRSNSPILAELSGGMDSSSIVCMADTILAEGRGETPRLDTVSYYDDSEPNWNEKPYFTKVEEKRGRTGCHIHIGTTRSFSLELKNRAFASTPAGVDTQSNEIGRQFADCIELQANRVVLSGVGGDEVMGGVPTPFAELLDLTASGRFGSLARQLNAWAKALRRPWFHLLFEALQEFLPVDVSRLPPQVRPASWLDQVFISRHQSALAGYPARIKLFASLPSFQENLTSLNALRRQIGCSATPSKPAYEKRYPFFDRTLLEFVYAIPRGQVIRPGQRRSLMRRALDGMVPNDLLHRRQKSFVSRSSLRAIATTWPELIKMNQGMVTVSFGITRAKEFIEALQEGRHGRQLNVVAVCRTIGIETWLRSSLTEGIFARPRAGDLQEPVSTTAREQFEVSSRTMSSASWLWK